MQKLNVELKIPIPENYVLIQKVEYLNYKELERKLEENNNEGKWWSMNDLEKRIGRSRDWIRDNILFRYRKILDVKCGGFVVYPESAGEIWTFQASKMTEFLDEYFIDIFSKNNKKK